MDNDDGYFDEQTAARYDEQSADMFEPGAVDPVVEVLAKLAGGGRALELGIGTGRIALPLARRGVPVHGIELSRAIAARLRAKPGGEAVGVTIGDFATTKVDGTFSVAYLVFNTIMNLTTQEAQVACFRNVAARLEPGGCFVIEVRVPELRRLPAGQSVLPWHMGPDHWVLYSYDVATQAMRGHYVEFVDGRCEYGRSLHQRQPQARLDLGDSHPLNLNAWTGTPRGRLRRSVEDLAAIRDAFRLVFRSQGGGHDVQAGLHRRRWPSTSRTRWGLQAARGPAGAGPGARRTRDGLTMESEARRISYQALRKGVPVRAAGGEEIGTVEHVLEVPELDVFDGIVLKTAGGLRFADADQVADITDRYVVLNLPAQETERLGRPQAPAVYHADPSEHAGGSLHDWFGRMFGRAHWKRDR